MCFVKVVFREFRFFFHISIVLYIIIVYCTFSFPRQLLTFIVSYLFSAQCDNNNLLHDGVSVYFLLF